MSTKKQAKSTLVFIPFPILSHQAAVIQMAKLLVDRDDRLSATIIVMKLPIDTKNNINSPLDSNINIVELPLDDSNFTKWSKLSPNAFAVNFIDSQKGPIRDVVVKIAKSSSKIAGFVVDMFCTTMIDVANELGIPSYVFFTCNAASLGLFLHLQRLSDEQNLDLSEYENSDAAISVPTYVNPVPAKVWPSIVFEKESNFPGFMRRFRETKGIIINTFLEFEPHEVKSLSDDEKIPNIYPVEPIIETGNDNLNKNDEIIKWLDEQLDSSVVFICFGSNGTFEKDQVDEIALALENSRQSFLWSLRKPPTKGKLEFPGEYENHEDILPDGFLE
ncbi:hypothetical protein CASFOL_011382 [Castilleja foliolosa]|uniref:Uncharacterized protein n=1 Tax=Castilleja foliolosa TaxID=1961234 RepID=A0ABD3DX90_9LAMI